jgi:hypothetical protein
LAIAVGVKIHCDFWLFMLESGRKIKLFMAKNPAARFGSFIFEGYGYTYENTSEELVVSLKYSLDGVENFEEKLTLKVEQKTWEKANKGALDKALDALFLAAGVSYYKAFCPPVIVQKVVPMNEEQAAFWTKLYERGLGEFFYQNQLDFRGLIKFQPNDKEQSEAISIPLKNRALLPLGGGKDSIVSAEILKKNGLEFINFSLRDAEPIRATAEITGKPRIIVGRQIAPRLISLNEEVAFNGHVPITAYISFLLVVCAIVYDYKYLIFSLEKSANFGQLEFHGMEINHQYSKSEEFEGDFRNYIAQYVCPQIEYFSLLRGFFELKIVEYFSRLENLDKYLPAFTSCNANFKIVKEKSPTRWCGHCPKCVFVFLCLAAFLPKDKLVETFGLNMFEQEDLTGLFEELLGEKNFKPFECVGTIEESRVALWKIATKPEWASDKIVKHFAPHLKKWGDLEREWAETLKIQSGHFVPAFLMETIKKMEK